ncbi:MAG: hypothetical protein Q7J85_11540 [Bacillota bacterium]|nr:hypothetical protein [Bacillota bacterium]
MDFDKWLQRFVTSVEKIIFRLALVLVVLLFIVQALLMDADSRLFLSTTDKLEGSPVLENIQDVMGRRVSNDLPPVVQEETALVLELLSPPNVNTELFLLVNGSPVAQLGEANIYVTVKAGDMLELTGSVPGDIPAVVRVVNVHGKLKTPEKGHEVTTFGENELLAWIIP